MRVVVWVGVGNIGLESSLEVVGLELNFEAAGSTAGVI